MFFRLPSEIGVYRVVGNLIVLILSSLSDSWTKLHIELFLCIQVVELRFDPGLSLRRQRFRCISCCWPVCPES